jgi:hypothetical protein
MEAIVGLILLAFLLVLYFLPAVVAYSRHHHQLVPILLINLFFGWTVLGWIGALIWACMHISRPTGDATVTE